MLNAISKRREGLKDDKICIVKQAFSVYSKPDITSENIAIVCENEVITILAADIPYWYEIGYTKREAKDERHGYVLKKRLHTCVIPKENKADEISKRQLEFAVFSIENVADKLGITGNKVYQLLTNNSNILDNYIIPCYESLHTQSKEYIVNDIIEYMKDTGVIK